MINTLIIGSGPSGLMCANILEKNKINYKLIEKNQELAKKLFITGGGRCNVTNVLDTRDFINELTIKNKKFLYGSIANFGTKETIDFFKEKGVELITVEDFFYFPETQKSQDIIEALLRDLNKGNIYLNETVKNIIKEDEHYLVKTNKRILLAKNVVIATGGSSYPNTGSTGDGMKFAKDLGIITIPFYPAESSVKSQFIANNKEVFQGITLLDKIVKIAGKKDSYTGNILFTHFGLSGPAILKISEFCYHDLKDNKDVYLEFNISNYNLEEYLEIQLEFQDSQKTLKSFVEFLTIKRLGHYILKSLKLDPAKKVRETSKKDLNRIKDLIINFKVKIDNTLAVEQAFVNGGGISLKELSNKSFEIKGYKGLYAVGETIDVHGPIGGFNITIAFSTGVSAARSIINQKIT
ncbi:MAG: aminoacetone oxidase family FAD-binding enzyme [Candidatus Izemoplasma sp.]